MKGPMPRNWQELYWAMTPVVTGWPGIMKDIGSNPEHDSMHLWEALSYQCKAVAARIDHVVDAERERKRAERRALYVTANQLRELPEECPVCGDPTYISAAYHDWACSDPECSERHPHRSMRCTS